MPKTLVINQREKLSGIVNRLIIWNYFFPFFCKKADGNLHNILNYRKLNLPPTRNTYSNNSGHFFTKKQLLGDNNQ